MVRQVELDRRHGHVAGADGVQGGARLTGAAGWRAADPEVIAPERVLASNQLVVVLAPAEAGDLDTLDVLTPPARDGHVQQDVTFESLAQDPPRQSRGELRRVAKAPLEAVGQGDGNGRDARGDALPR